VLCTFCDGKTKVINVRHSDGKRYRRRECVECNERFTTYETNFETLIEVFDEHLPVEVVDEISNVLAEVMPDRS